MAAAANTNNEKSDQGINAENLFALDAPEFAVSFRGGAKIFSHVFRRTVAADWEEYFDACAAEAADADVGESTASLVLYRRIILRVAGYRTPDGRKPEDLPGWPDCISRDHRLFAAKLFQQSYAGVTTQTFDFGATRRSVSFLVVQDVDGDSAKREIFGVAHHFRPPTMDHYRRFLHATAEFPSSARRFASLYDELAVSAEGYSVGGAPLAPQHVQREMLLPHKIYAVTFLLSFDNSDLEPCRRNAVILPADLLRMKTPAPGVGVN